jgi:antitoxin component YwqK of YwqJK toxin-antitoxin module
MKEEIIEYHPNGSIKHKIIFYSNGQKYHEQFYDQRGNFHRKQGLPDYQKWYDNGITCYITYYVHGRKHNIGNPNSIRFNDNGKIQYKSYRLNDKIYSKLTWMNLIKNI